MMGSTSRSDKGLKVIETERGPIAPRSGLIIERAGVIMNMPRAVRPADAGGDY